MLIKTYANINQSQDNAKSDMEKRYLMKHKTFIKTIMKILIPI